MDYKKVSAFLKKLKKNNTREWMDANKKEYDALRKDWLAFVQNLIGHIGAFDEQIASLEAKSCVFRINRDIRFSNDKSPYKTNFGASINKGGKNAPSAGYYIHLEPGNCFLAGGAYMPDAEHLARIRQEIDYDLDAFESMLKAKSFKKYFGQLGGDKLSRPPKGYEADNKAVEYLKHKSFLMMHPLDEAKLGDAKAMAYCTEVFKAMKPMLDFLNRGL